VPYFDWNKLKNEKLKAERNVCFEDVLIAIDTGAVLDDVKHPKVLRYGTQRMLFVVIEDYVYVVPYIEDDEKVFLRTIIPSRKATKKYLRGDSL